MPLNEFLRPYYAATYFAFFCIVASANSRADEAVSRDPASAPRSAVRDSQTDSPVPETPEERDDHLSGNWGGARDKLSSQGFDLSLVYKGDVENNLVGGQKHVTNYLGNLDIRASFDLEKMMNWSGGRLFFYALGNHGDDPSKSVGDAQGTSNIEAPANTIKLYEAWYQQLLFDKKFSVLVGLHDLNSEFYVTETSTIFLNNSFGTGKDLSQTGKNGPSIFPVTSVAARLRYEPNDKFYVQGAVFNAVSGDPDNPYRTTVEIRSNEGALSIGEVGYQLRGPKGELEDKLALGYWVYSRTFDQINDSGQGTNQGFYVTGEHLIGSQISVFARYGSAASDVNKFDFNASAGIVDTGIFSARPKDRLGFAVTQAHASSSYRALQSSQNISTIGAETTCELTYRFEIIAGIAIQPDYQWVIHPNADSANLDAQVASLRFELSL